MFESFNSCELNENFERISFIKGKLNFYIITVRDTQTSLVNIIKHIIGKN